MWMVVVGVLAVTLKLLDIGFMAPLSWWWVLSPFAVAVVWWQVADSTGVTQRKAMRRADEKAAERRQTQLDALGLGTTQRGRGGQPPQAPDKPRRDRP